MQSLGLLLHDAARHLRTAFERRARDRRMTLMQWRTLGALAKQGGLTQAALAARIEASPMTVSDILDRLETAGLIRREPDPADARAKLVSLTDRAQPIVEEMRQIAAEVYDTALAGLDETARTALMTSLHRISANLTADAEQKETT